MNLVKRREDGSDHETSSMKISMKINKKWKLLIRINRLRDVKSGGNRVTNFDILRVDACGRID